MYYGLCPAGMFPLSKENPSYNQVLVNTSVGRPPLLYFEGYKEQVEGLCLNSLLSSAYNQMAVDYIPVYARGTNFPENSETRVPICFA